MSYRLSKIVSCLAIFFITFLIYNFNLSYETSGDVKPAALLPVILIKNHSLDFKDYYKDPLQYWFRKIISTNKIVSAYPIVPGLLATPIYLVPHLLGFDITKHVELLSKLSASAIVALAVVFMFLALGQIFKKKTTWLMTVIFAFATNIWTVASRGLWQHGPNLLFINLFFYFWFLGRQKEKFLPWCGLFMGLAIWCRPANLIFFLPLVFYFLLYYRQQFSKFCALVAVPLILMLGYSYVYFGQITNLGQAQTSGFSGLFIKGFLGLLFSPSHGLFTHTPIFIFSFVAGYLIFKKRNEAFYKYLIVGLLLLLFLYSKWFMWWGGWSFGYRLLLEIVPGLIILLGFIWENYLVKVRIWKYCFFVLLFFSLATELVGAFFSPCYFSDTSQSTVYNQRSLWQWSTHPFFSCINRESFLDKGKRIDLIP